MNKKNKNAKKEKKENQTSEINKNRLEQTMMMNLFGENDLKIYIFNKIGLCIIIALFIFILVYCYLQLKSVNKGHNDSFSSTINNLAHDSDYLANLHKDSNFF